MTKSRGTRRKARELALSALYMIEMQAKGSDGEEENDIIERFFKERGAGPATVAYARRLINGVRTHSDFIDKKIEEACEHWKLSRIAPVDRNILRISACEILFDTDIPHEVSIDEAVEIAKKYGSEESGAFVNGILDHLKKDKENFGF